MTEMEQRYEVKMNEMEQRFEVKLTEMRRETEEMNKRMEKEIVDLKKENGTMKEKVKALEKRSVDIVAGELSDLKVNVVEGATGGSVVQRKVNNPAQCKLVLHRPCQQGVRISADNEVE